MDEATQLAMQKLQEQQALKDILTVGGIGLAGGLGLRGLAGLPSFFGHPSAKNNPRSMGQSVVAIPTPVYATPADQRRALQSKSAADLVPSRDDLKYYYPGMVAAGLGGFVGGNWLMDRFLKSKAQSDLKAQESDAQSEYQKAMLEQYDPKLLPTADRVPVSDYSPVRKQIAQAPPPPQLKLASDETMQDLEKLAEAYEKQSTLLGYELPSMGQTLGAYGAYAVPAAALGGYLSYEHFKDRSPETLLQGAIKDRERERWARRPPEIYAVPQPVHVDRAGGMTEAPEKQTPRLAQLALAGA